jgi:uncharacterized protein (TIGR03083 family)
MTTMTPTDVTDIPRIDHDEAMDLQAIEFGRAVELLRTLDQQQWMAQTDCPDWNVHQMWMHVLAELDAGASIRENVHQLRSGWKRQKELDESLADAISANQIEERDHLSPAEVLDRLERTIPKGIKGRKRTPGLVRRAKISIDAPVVEKWTLGYLIDIIYLRDPWMHRIDTTKATGAELELTAAHDGRIVAEIVSEWARRLGKPFSLELTGVAGGSFTSGEGGDHIVMDAVEFCCVLSGRGEATGLLETAVPF